MAEQNTEQPLRRIYMEFPVKAGDGTTAGQALWLIEKEVSPGVTGFSLDAGAVKFIPSSELASFAFRLHVFADHIDTLVDGEEIAARGESPEEMIASQGDAWIFGYVERYVDRLAVILGRSLDVERVGVRDKSSLHEPAPDDGR